MSVLHIPIVHAHDVSKQIPREIEIEIEIEIVIKQLVHTSYEARGKFGEHSRSWSCSRRSQEQLLRIFRALQTSRLLHISMNAR